MSNKNSKLFRGIVSFFVLLGFLLNTSGAVALAQSTTLLLPAPTQFIHLSPNYSHPVLKGLKFNPNSPLKVEFIIDTADKGEVSQEEASRLIKYFLAALTMPKEDIWVNLSPYEADTIAEEHLSQTDLGRDLLSQDFILKQLSSSLTYPESDTGKDFWKQTYKQVIQLAGTTNIPINTFNKVWIVPKSSEVYENKDTALITQARLDVLLEQDYLSLHKNISSIKNHQSKPKDKLIQDINQASSNIMKQLILPKIKRDVNFGKNFANLRQIYHSLILGFWFKGKFKDTIYKHYINQAKIKGINLPGDTDSKDKIYQHYLKAFKTGLYDYIKADYDPKSQKNIRRRYFSGGSSFARLPTTTRTRYQLPPGVNDADQLLIGPATRVVAQAEAAGTEQRPEQYALASSGVATLLDTDIIEEALKRQGGVVTVSGGMIMATGFRHRNPASLFRAMARDLNEDFEQPSGGKFNIGSIEIRRYYDTDDSDPTTESNLLLDLTFAGRSQSQRWIVQASSSTITPEQLRTHLLTVFEDRSKNPIILEKRRLPKSAQEESPFTGQPYTAVVLRQTTTWAGDRSIQAKTLLGRAFLQTDDLRLATSSDHNLPIYHAAFGGETLTFEEFPIAKYNKLAKHTTKKRKQEARQLLIDKVTQGQGDLVAVLDIKFPERPRQQEKTKKTRRYIVRQQASSTAGTMSPQQAADELAVVATGNQRAEVSELNDVPFISFDTSFPRGLRDLDMLFPEGTSTAGVFRLAVKQKALLFNPVKGNKHVAVEEFKRTLKDRGRGSIAVFSVKWPNSDEFSYWILQELLLNTDTFMPTRSSSSVAEKQLGEFSASDQAKINQVTQAFKKQLDDDPEIVVIAPARDNDQGEHVDYPDAQFGGRDSAHLYSMGRAIQLNYIVAASENQEKKINIHYLDKGKVESFSCSLSELADLRNAAKARREKKPLPKPGIRKLPPWVNHTLGVLWVARKDHKIPLKGIDIVFSSDIPSGAGISKSAANCCSIAIALNRLYKMKLNSLMKIAELARDGEHDAFVGSKCGWLDQLIVLNSKKNHFTMIDYANKSIKHFKSKLPKALRRVLVDTKVTHDLATEEYVDRVAELKLAFETLGAVLGKRVTSTTFTLRDINALIQRLDPSVPEISFKQAVGGQAALNLAGLTMGVKQEGRTLTEEAIGKIADHVRRNYRIRKKLQRHKDLANRSESFALLLRRMRHQLTSGIRTPLTGKAAQAGKANVFGQLINAEGESLRLNGDMQITGENGAQDVLLDSGFDAARELGIPVYGRMEGGGGGGKVGFYVHTVNASTYKMWQQRVVRKYNSWARSKKLIDKKSGQIKISNKDFLDSAMEDGARIVNLASSSVPIEQHRFDIVRHFRSKGNARVRDDLSYIFKDGQDKGVETIAGYNFSERRSFVKRIPIIDLGRGNEQTYGLFLLEQAGMSERDARALGLELENLAGKNPSEQARTNSVAFIITHTKWGRDQHWQVKIPSEEPSLTVEDYRRDLSKSLGLLEGIETAETIGKIHQFRLTKFPGRRSFADFIKENFIDVTRSKPGSFRAVYHAESYNIPIGIKKLSLPEIAKACGRNPKTLIALVDEATSSDTKTYWLITWEGKTKHTRLAASSSVELRDIASNRNISNTGGIDLQYLETSAASGSQTVDVGYFNQAATSIFNANLEGITFEIISIDRIEDIDSIL